jgi:hypothetical protein
MLKIKTRLCKNNYHKFWDKITVIKIMDAWTFKNQLEQMNQNNYIPRLTL